MNTGKYRLIGRSGLVGMTLLVCFAGCKKDEQSVLQIARADYQPQQVEKTYIGQGLDDMVAYWQTTDQVNINGTACNISDVNITQAKAIGATPQNGGYAAVYPSGSFTGSGGSATGGSVTIPASQTYSVVDGRQVINAPMAAKLPATSGVLFFRNVVSLLRIAVMNGNENSKSFTVNSIAVSADNSVKLSGTQAFTFPTNTESSDITTGSLTSGGDVTLTGCDAAGAISAGDMKIFNIVVAPYSTACKLTVTVNGTLQGSSAQNYTITQNTARTLSHGEVGVQFFATNFDKQ